MNLTGTQKLQAILAGAKTSLDAVYTVNYTDIPLSPGANPISNPQSAQGSTNGSTAVDVVAAPPAGYIRQVDSIILNNADTGSITLSFRINDGAASPTTYVFWKGTRATLEQLFYSRTAGFQGYSVAMAKQ